jgi:hypothetical protein
VGRPHWLCGLGFTLGMGTSAFETGVGERVPGLEKRETWGTQSQSPHPNIEKHDVRMGHPQSFMWLSFTLGMGIPKPRCGKESQVSKSARPGAPKVKVPTLTSKSKKKTRSGGDPRHRAFLR